LESDRKIARFDLRLLPRTEQLVSVTALVIFFASGFSALLYQVIWQRMLGFFSGADVYSVTIIVAAYMAGMGVGSLTGGYLADRLSRRGNLALFASVELGIALFALGSKGIVLRLDLPAKLAHLASSPFADGGRAVLQFAHSYLSAWVFRCQRLRVHSPVRLKGQRAR
jgi:spermidine synthase